MRIPLQLCVNTSRTKGKTTLAILMISSEADALIAQVACGTATGCFEEG